jgi:hypothetical protein
MITWTRELGRGMYAVEQLVLAKVNVHTRTAPTARRSFIVILPLERARPKLTRTCERLLLRSRAVLRLQIFDRVGLDLILCGG